MTWVQQAISGGKGACSSRSPGAGRRMLALVGENGAGMSHADEDLSGVYAPVEGTFAIDGQIVEPKKPTMPSNWDLDHLSGIQSLPQTCRWWTTSSSGAEPNRSGFVDRGPYAGSGPRLLAPGWGSISIPDRGPQSQRRPAANGFRNRQKRSPTTRASSSWTNRPQRSTDNEVRALFEIIKSLKERGLAVVFVLPSPG